MSKIITKQKFVVLLFAILLVSINITFAQESTIDESFDNLPKIAFVSDRDGDNEIFLMNADGSEVIQLTDNWSNDTAPAWSPDGEWIAFGSDRDGFPNIYIMDAVGDDQQQLTFFESEQYFDTHITWSPDGQKIAFNMSGSSKLFLMNADGSGLQELVSEGSHPSWSPDGRYIAFTQFIQNSMQIYRLNLETMEQINISNTEGQSDWASWHPSGQQIIYSANTRGLPDILLMNADGSNQEILLDWQAGPGHGSKLSPAWSPDGRKIAYVFDQSGNSEIMIVHADTTFAQDNITNGPAQDTHPAWQPIQRNTTNTVPVEESSNDSKGKITFVSDRDGTYQVYTMNADGSDIEQVTNDAGHKYYPTWSPDGNTIAYTATGGQSVRDTDIYTINTEANNVTQIADNIQVSYLTWSPNGQLIAMTVKVEDESRTTEIGILNADGTNGTLLTDNTFNDGFFGASWSPNSQNIVFGACPDECGLYTMHIDGLNPQLLISGYYDAPAWSPDGQQIVFGNGLQSSSDLFIVNADGSNLRTLLKQDTFRPLFPSWSPDSKEIVFAADFGGGGREIYKINVETLEITALTNTGGWNDVPEWQPMPDQGN